MEYAWPVRWVLYQALAYPREDGFLMPILQVRKLRLRARHTATRGKASQDPQTGVCGEREKCPGNATAGATRLRVKALVWGRCRFFKDFLCVVSFMFYVLCSRSWYFYLTGEEVDVKLLPKAIQTLS